MSDQLIDTAALRAQEAVAFRLIGEMEAYARRIGCRVIHDGIECHTEEQSNKLAKWWTENVGK